MLGIIPGFLSVTRKTSLIRTLTAAYGSAAWQLVPRTFKLPDELDDWARWLGDHPEVRTRAGHWLLAG